MERGQQTIGGDGAAARRRAWDAVLLVARLALAAIFWTLGRAAADGLGASDDTKFTFEFDYRLPLVNPYVAAHVMTVAEWALAVLLLLGLLTRSAAVGLIAVTLVIQAFIAPAGWPAHALWAAVLMLLAVKGGGAMSLDALIARRGRG